MSRRGLPGPVRRLWRQPLRTGAIVLLAVTALAASGIQSAAAMARRSSLDENWRGLYDIVVTPAAAVAPIDGMLPPNTLASTGDGLSLDDLRAVRGIDGVEIAAPVGEIVVPGLKFQHPRVAIPRGFVGATEVPQAFRLTATYTTDDGLGERLVEQRDLIVVVDEASRLRSTPATECDLGEWTISGRNGEYRADPELYPALTAWACSWRDGQGDGVTVYLGGAGGGAERMGNHDQPGRTPDPVLNFDLPSAPQTMTRITLVDPVAERALLGDAGAIFDPLIAAGPSGDLTVEDMRAWADAADADAFAQRFRDELAQGDALSETGWTDEQLAELRALFTANDDDWDDFMAGLSRDMPVMPLLATPDAAAQLSLKLDVEHLGDAPAQSADYGDVIYDVPDATSADAPVGTAVADISDLLNPFAGRSPGIAWPGADVTITEQLVEWNSLYAAQLLSPRSPSFTAADGIVLQPNGYVSPVLDMSGGPTEPDAILGGDPTEAGVEAAYSGLESLWMVGPDHPDGLVAVPVGEFDARDLALDETAANYVPLGAYAPVSSTVSDGPHAGATMLPSLAGLGLVSPRTVAIASIESAPLWGAQNPVSAIRVRVSGIDAYTPEAQAKVIRVAQAIEALGFSASVVAGSSPTDVDVTVDAYAFGTMDAATGQSVGELGTVTQRWSELGAAARVELSVSSATLAILGIALAAGVLLLGAVQVAGIPGRRVQANAMREVGFTRVRIARWFAAEELPGFIVVAAVAAIAWIVSGGTGAAATAGIAAAAIVLVLAVVSVLAGSRVAGTRMPRDARSRRLGAHSVAGFGARQALVHPLTTTIHVLAIVIVGLASAGLASALLAGREGAGESSLALLTVGRQLLPQIALGVAGIAAGILLARLTRRLDLAARADQWAALRAAGWTSGQLAAAQRVEGLAISVPALVAAGALTWFGAQWLGLDRQPILTGIAVLAGLLTAVIAFSTRRKGTS